VAVGVLLDTSRRQVLVARRPSGKDFAGFWEFPGGKVEQGESLLQALEREMLEELGVRVHSARPLITLHHDYVHKSVVLHTFIIGSYEGELRGREGQPIRWLGVDALDRREFPAANAGIIQALSLPERYLITPPPDEHFLPNLESALQQGIRLVCLRAKNLALSEYLGLCEAALSVCENYHARLLVHYHWQAAREFPVYGVHLTADQLREGVDISASSHYAASCHDADELALAHQCGAHFVVAGPVFDPRSHPVTRSALNWEGFASLTEQSRVPVFALGGLSATNLPQAWRHGGQGVAAVSAYWPKL